MTPVEVIEKQIQQGMFDGNRHETKRNCGNLAGGYYAGGALNLDEVDHLKEICMSLSDTPTETARQWDKAFEYGTESPLTWDQHGNTRHIPNRALVRGEALKYEAPVLVDKNYIQVGEFIQPSDADWSPEEQVIKYLTALFDADENVGYVTESWFNEKAGRHLPQKGCYDRTAGQLISELQQWPFRRVFGDYNPEVGAWIRFNPMDGVGVTDENVVSYKYALVESDVVEVPRQIALIKDLKLPVAALVYSGGKSVHAVVKIYADTLKEYRERVDILYAVCEKNGLVMDRQNRNPSRLSRMPGVLRNGNKQFVIDTHIGMSSWKEWHNWAEDVRDDLPQFETDTDDLDEPELDPQMIEGILRKGHKLLLSGPSKAGKSFCLQQLAIAVATGGYWLGWKVRQGRVAYINLELALKSNKHRLWQIKRKLGVKTNGNLDVWNLRGNAVSMDKLAPKIIRRSEDRGYSMIIVDPIYKVLTGDENSAQEMAYFCNQFDKIAVNLGVTVVYAHHHSKGAQGQKSSRDRSSGSGVFSRDPDAIIDMIELIIDDNRRTQITRRWHARSMAEELDWVSATWRDDNNVTHDDLEDPARLQEIARKNNYDIDGQKVQDELKSAKYATGWRIEGTLREFPGFEPRNVFFKYPLHILETGEGSLLADATPESSEDNWRKGQKVAEKVNKNIQAEKNAEFRELFDEIAEGRTEVNWKDLEEVGGGTMNTIKKRCRYHPDFKYVKGQVILKLETTEVKND